MPESRRSDGCSLIGAGSLSPLSFLRENLERDRSSSPRSPCIFKTPSILYRHKENAFLPNYFSIGPVHHGKENLVASEKIKIKYLNGLLSRLTTSLWQETKFDQEAKKIKEQEILTELIDAVKLIEKRASDCYAEHDFAAVLGEKFLVVMVLDGCFIIELFRKYAGVIIMEFDDPIFSMPCMLQFLSHDLILLENQIPWLVLESLFEKTKLPFETEPLIPLALNFSARTFSSNPRRINAELFKGEDIKHILDLLWLSLFLPSKIKHEQNWEWKPVRTITRLQEAGVKFKRVAVDSVLDIRFEKGTLKIPSLLIQETTETILRNLIAYEQCLPNCPPIFTSFAKLLDNLIDTPNDLDILYKREIYDIRLTPEDAYQFFNNLCNDTYVSAFYYETLRSDLNQYYKCWWRKGRAYLVRNYFSKPWVLAAIYALIIFVLTFWQTFIKKVDL